MSFLLFNIPGWIFSRKFPAAGKRHALCGRLSRSWKTSRAPRETFANCENVTRSAGDFRKLRNGHATRGKLSQVAKTSCAPQETFANCEKTESPEGLFSQRAKKPSRPFQSHPMQELVLIIIHQVNLRVTLVGRIA